jgi:hypothetical protein
LRFFGENEKPYHNPVGPSRRAQREIFLKFPEDQRPVVPTFHWFTALPKSLRIMSCYDFATFITGDHCAIAVAEISERCMELTIQERDQMVGLAFGAGAMHTKMPSIRLLSLMPKCLYPIQCKTYQSHFSFSPFSQKLKAEGTPYSLWGLNRDLWRYWGTPHPSPS